MTNIRILAKNISITTLKKWYKYYAMQKSKIVASGTTSDLSNEVIQQF